jgi:hypothetical protein
LQKVAKIIWLLFNRKNCDLNFAKLYVGRNFGRFLESIGQFFLIETSGHPETVLHFHNWQKLAKRIGMPFLFVGTMVTR